jgi:hypothetical protein
MAAFFPTVLTAVLTLFLAAGGLTTAATGGSPSTIRLNTGQRMPFINLGGTSQSVKAGNHYSNYSEFLRQGGRGLDTALVRATP